MNELVPIRETNNRITILGRDLHKFLEVNERYSTWFERILSYGFEENIDFVGCKTFNTLARQELQNHQLTLEMAKEISMLQRNDKGKQARKYFIECEKKLTQFKKFSLRESLEMNIKLLDENESLKIELKETTIEKDKIAKNRQKQIAIQGGRAIAEKNKEKVYQMILSKDYDSLLPNKSKLTIRQFINCIDLLKSGVKNVLIASILNLHEDTILRIKNKSRPMYQIIFDNYKSIKKDLK